MWPVQSRWNQYSACRSLIGRDSMRVRSMPRTASSVSSPSSEPGRFWVVAASVVRSWPVGAGGGAGRGEQHEAGDGARVVRDVVGEHRRGRAARAASGAATAASISPARHLGGRLAVEVLTRTSACGQVRGRSSRGSGRCRGCARRPSGSRRVVVPGRTMTANRTASTTSLTIISGGSSSSPSSTGGTAPSTLFSIGTQPASALPVPDRGEHGRAPRARHQLRAPGLGQRRAGPAR